MRNRTRRNKGRRNKDRFIFTNDINLIKPYAGYHICIEGFISRFGSMTFFFTKKISVSRYYITKIFVPLTYKTILFVWIYVIYINENQRGKGHGKSLMQNLLKHFQIVIHLLDDSLGFFEQISKDLDLGLETKNTCMPFGSSFISSNLNINRQQKVNSFIGGCGREFPGFKRYACLESSKEFAILNTDKKLIELNISLRYQFKKKNASQLLSL